MKTLNFVKMLLLCVITLSFASCGDENYYTIQNSDEKLCDKTWTDEQETSDGTFTYQLKFYKDNKGQEISTTYSTGGKTTIDREFSWRWTDNSKEALRLIFTDGKIKNFENVWVREHYLSGKLDGEIVMFADANYK